VFFKAVFFKATGETLFATRFDFIFDPRQKQLGKSQQRSNTGEPIELALRGLSEYWLEKI
jgi:hypothetical protein